MATAIVHAAQAADPADPVAATTAGTRQVFWLLLGVMVVAGLLAGAAVLPGSRGPGRGGRGAGADGAILAGEPRDV